MINFYQSQTVIFSKKSLLSGYVKPLLPFHNPTPSLIFSSFCMFLLSTKIIQSLKFHFFCHFCCLKKQQKSAPCSHHSLKTVAKLQQQTFHFSQAFTAYPIASIACSKAFLDSPLLLFTKKPKKPSTMDGFLLFKDTVSSSGVRWNDRELLLREQRLHCLRVCEPIVLQRAV